MGPQNKDLGKQGNGSCFEPCLYRLRVWKGLARKGTVGEARRNSEIMKVVWSRVVKDPAVLNRKETKESGQPNEDIFKRNMNQR